MQYISLLAQAAPAAPDLNALLAEFQQILGALTVKDLALAVIAANVLYVISWWISSNVVARENGSFLNALKLWGFYFVGIVLTSLIVAVVAIGAGQSARGGGLVLLISVLLTILVVVGGPILIYGIGFLRSVGFIIISLIVSMAGQLLLTTVVPLPKAWADFAAFGQKVQNLPPDQRVAFMEALRAQTATKQGAKLPGPAGVAADRSKSIEERHAALQNMYADLEKRRKNLQLGDTAGLDAYNRDNAIYQELLKQLQAEAAK